jgi:predicted transcriptional regulator
MRRQTLSDYLPEMRRQGLIATAGEGTAALQYITEKGKELL